MHDVFRFDSCLSSLYHVLSCPFCSVAKPVFSGPPSLLWPFYTYSQNIFDQCTCLYVDTYKPLGLSAPSILDHTSRFVTSYIFSLSNQSRESRAEPVLNYYVIDYQVAGFKSKTEWSHQWRVTRPPRNLPRESVPWLNQNQEKWKALSICCNHDCLAK